MDGDKTGHQTGYDGGQRFKAVPRRSKVSETLPLANKTLTIECWNVRRPSEPLLACGIVRGHQRPSNPQFP